MKKHVDDLELNRNLALRKARTNLANRRLFLAWFWVEQARQFWSLTTRQETEFKSVLQREVT